MEDNRTSIKKRLDDIFIEKMGYLVSAEQTENT